jgi:hypothetical protein
LCCLTTMYKQVHTILSAGCPCSCCPAVQQNPPKDAEAEPVVFNESFYPVAMMAKPTGPPSASQANFGVWISRDEWKKQQVELKRGAEAYNQLLQVRLPCATAAGRAKLRIAPRPPLLDHSARAALPCAGD